LDLGFELVCDIFEISASELYSNIEERLESALILLRLLTFTPTSRRLEFAFILFDFLSLVVKILFRSKVLLEPDDLFSYVLLAYFRQRI
jgi:hypothetical protein